MGQIAQILLWIYTIGALVVSMLILFMFDEEELEERTKDLPSRLSLVFGILIWPVLIFIMIEMLIKKK